MYIDLMLYFFNAFSQCSVSTHGKFHQNQLIFFQVDLTSFQVGGIYLACDGGIFYRVRIESLSPIQVLFIDSGEIKVCRKEEIRSIPVELQVRNFVFKFGLVFMCKDVQCQKQNSSVWCGACLNQNNLSLFLKTGIRL